MKARKLTKFAPVATVALAAVLGLAACGGAPAGGDTSQGSNAGSATQEAAGEYTLVSDGTLTFATSPDFPPFENLDENGDYVGFDIEVGRAVAEKLGLDCEFTTLQFDGIIPAVAAGGQADAGISGITVDPQRAEQVDFTDTYYIADQAIATMKDSDITSDNVVDALNAEGMVIAVQSGTTGEQYAQEHYPNATIQPYGNATDCFAAMQSGQANAVIMDMAVVESMVSDAYTDAQIVKTEATGEEYAIAVSKDNPALTEAINDALTELDEDGTLDALVSEYLG